MTYKTDLISPNTGISELRACLNEGLRNYKAGESDEILVDGIPIKNLILNEVQHGLLYPVVCEMENELRKVISKLERAESNYNYLIEFLTSLVVNDLDLQATEQVGNLAIHLIQCQNSEDD